MPRQQVPTMTNSEPFYKLKIIGGLHKDAELFLAPDIQYSLGSSDECDIILSDAGVAQKHLSFSISQGKIRLEKTDAPLYVDGTSVGAASSELESFQIVGIGGAHLAIGPANEIWPTIQPPPPINPPEPAPTCLDLVVVDTDRYALEAVRQPSPFQAALKDFLVWINRFDRKVLIAVCSFVLVFLIFAFDVLRSVAVAGDTRPNSMLLSMIDGIMTVKQTTLVGTGFSEPNLPTESRIASTSDDPSEHIRKILKNTWGRNLTETRDTSGSIQFKGHDEQNRTDLLMNLEQNDQGETEAFGITLSPKKKKEILSRMGDVIRVKVDAAEEMEGACKRILEKKGVRLAKAKLDIDESTFTLQGQSDDSQTISSIHDIITHAFPRIQVNNEVTWHAQADVTGKSEITGVSSGKVPYIIQNDGSKVFTGGKLDNGCHVVQIGPESIEMDCNGSRRKQAL
jgi:hypothetical protein